MSATPKVVKTTQLLLVPVGVSRSVYPGLTYNCQRPATTGSERPVTKKADTPKATLPLFFLLALNGTARLVYEADGCVHTSLDRLVWHRIRTFSTVFSMWSERRRAIEGAWAARSEAREAAKIIDMLMVEKGESPQRRKKRV